MRNLKDNERTCSSTNEITSYPVFDDLAPAQYGETVVQAAVYGPSEIKVSKELYHKAVVDVSFKRNVGQSDSADRIFEQFVRNAVEPVILTQLHPRTSINIFLQEIQDDGNMLSCCVNAACLALLDAGIPMNGVVAAVSIGIFSDNIIPFPSEKEIKSANCVMTVVIKSVDREIAGIKMSSFLPSQEIEKCIKLAQESAEDIFKFYRNTMEKRYKKSVT